MPFTVTMPKLSPTMEEGTISKWHKNEGDKVESGELLVEITTDKATVEYNALDEGFLRKKIVKEGESVGISDPIAIFTETSDESIEGFEAKLVETKIPKASIEKKEEMDLKEERPVEKVVPAMGMPAFIPEPPLEHYEFPFLRGSEKKVKASPLAKKLAKEQSLDLTTVKGTGPQGRVTSHDLKMAQKVMPSSRNQKEMPTIIPGSFDEIALTPMRKAIGKRLQQSKSFIPHFYVRQEINVDALVQIREELKAAEFKITYNDFCIRAVALALKEHPEINSGFNSVNQSIISFKTIDISVAVTIDSGLITPIVRHADYKTLGEISVEMKELAARAKAGKLQQEEYKGGSFTISNLGMFGVSDFVAVINPPQSAILAISGIEDCIRLKNGNIVPGKKMNITLSADHRVIDGSMAGQFIKTVQKYLENPSILLIS